MASAQFHHRIGGYVLLVVSIGAWWVARSGPHVGVFRLIALLCCVQMVIGIVTILNAAPVGLALLHQGFGVLLWLAAISAVFLLGESYKAAKALNVTKVNLPDSLLKTISPPSA
jgi:cytochrome c oxidase assembly protein subunit 15